LRHYTAAPTGQHRQLKRIANENRARADRTCKKRRDRTRRTISGAASRHASSSCRSSRRTGIFAQRGKNRPNRLGTTICALVRVEGRTLVVQELDAIDGTPVLDIKPVMAEFLPRSAVRQPAWSHELMSEYWLRK
jgi:tRNA (Thr-GGU) A37 N-methylase